MDYLKEWLTPLIENFEAQSASGEGIFTDSSPVPYGCMVPRVLPYGYVATVSNRAELLYVMSQIYLSLKLLLSLQAQPMFRLLKILKKQLIENVNV